MRTNLRTRSWLAINMDYRHRSNEAQLVVPVGSASAHKSTNTTMPIPGFTITAHEEVRNEETATFDPASPVLHPHISTATGESVYTTFSYQRAMRNRVNGEKLKHGGKYDTSRFAPIFIYDVLQLPGSLANVLGMSSSVDLIRRMTPGIVRGCVLRADDQEHPVLHFTGLVEHCVTGMLLFARGARSRDKLAEHYGDGFDADTVSVQFALDDGKTEVRSAHVWMRKHGVGRQELEHGLEDPEIKDPNGDDGDCRRDQAIVEENESSFDSDSTIRPTRTANRVFPPEHSENTGHGHARGDIWTWPEWTLEKYVAGECGVPDSDSSEMEW